MGQRRKNYLRKVKKEGSATDRTRLEGGRKINASHLRHLERYGKRKQASRPWEISRGSREEGRKGQPAE